MIFGRLSLGTVATGLYRVVGAWSTSLTRRAAMNAAKHNTISHISWNRRALQESSASDRHALQCFEKQPCRALDSASDAEHAHSLCQRHTNH